MYVSELQINDYRNYVNQKIELSPHVNIFVGDNAQGKTNLLEAIYICSVGRSDRTPRDKELIRWDCTRAKISLKVIKSYGDDRVDIIIDKSSNKRIAINETPISKIGELMGVVSSVLFSPEEMKIVKESPSERRRFIDIALCQMSRAYFYMLNRYNKILSQRNKLLKSQHATSDAIDVWDAQLATVGAKIIKTRRGYVTRLNKWAEINHSYLTSNKEIIKLNYEGIEGDSVEVIEGNFAKLLVQYRERDKLLGYTHIGPQKDDLAIEINGIDVRSYGSQGQQRTASLSLKLAELDLAKSETGEYPILLLDDVLSELDRSRQLQLIRKIRDFQTIITCTHMEDDLRAELGDYREFIVENGQVKL